jgi:serine protease inhibitor
MDKDDKSRHLFPCIIGINPIIFICVQYFYDNLSNNQFSLTPMALRISNLLIAVCVVCAILCLFLASCTQPITPSAGTPVVTLGATELRVAATNNDFALSLFKEVAQTERGSNMFISPFSYMQALTMTWNGAGGTTRDSMQRALRLAGISENDANTGLKNLSAYLRGLDTTKVEFRTANGIWYNTRITPEPAFISVVKDVFGSEIRGKVFGTDAVKDDINRWVEQQTNNRVKDLIQEEFSKDYLMCLVNAVYFNGEWKYRFDSTATLDGNFFNEDGSTRRCKLMTTGKQNPIRLSTLGNARVVELPYGNERYSMTAILPNTGKLSDVLTAITPQTWNDAVSRLSSSATVVVMPKFTMKTRYEERETMPRELHKMGMGIAFSNRADFTRMYRPPTDAKISFVIHQTFLQVDERGTEAAAATAVGIVEKTSIGPTPFLVRLDRPFAFVIRERETGTILFAGAVYQP